MAGGDQVLGGERAAAAEVGGDGVDARMFELASDDSDGQALFREAQQQAIGGGRLQRRDDDAGEALAMERFERAHFRILGFAGRGDEGGVAAGLGVAWTALARVTEYGLKRSPIRMPMTCDRLVLRTRALALGT